MKALQKSFYSFSFVLMLASLISCTGTVNQTSFNAKLLAAATTADTIVIATTSALKSHKITPDDAQNVASVAKATAAGLQIAKDMQNTNPAVANAKVDTVKEMLDTLNTYVTTIGVKQ